MFKGGLIGWLLDKLLGLFGLARKTNETNQVQEVKKENLELRAENARVQIEAGQQQEAQIRNEKLSKANTPKKKLGVVLDRLRNRVKRVRH